MEEYKDLLQEGLRQRVDSFISGFNDDLPDGLADIDKERLIYNVTNLAIGKLNAVVDNLIKSALFDFERLVHYSKKSKNKLS